ncbi:hypothetical protein Agub_g10095 [Astrephomene gubernaculifera]|uniref:Sugar phosphate transporter domain-containing protein n=1 Tax=Astrephomene gubernaculifera TaxID=47775 RepID=A0AAD3DX17_9CHLO|nr:hypothetical protein Agub_g10095 [Astrephomene gubernaculifera]
MATLTCRAGVPVTVGRRSAAPVALLSGLPIRSSQVLGSRLPAAKPVAPVRARQPIAVRAQAADAAKELDPLETTVSKVVGVKLAPTVVTLSFIAIWYALNIGFNLLNKTIFKYFPFPYTVSTVHVLVGLVYCVVVYVLGMKGWSFGRPVTGQEFKNIFGPAAMHAVGHVAANISFAAVAISLTHTVKTLEPAFNVVLSQVILGEATPLPVLLSLVPIMFGVALASAGELSFNWIGFLTAMASNLTFGFRAVWSKRAMTKSLDGTAVYAYTTLISVLICLPWALFAEGSSLAAGVQTAIAKVGAQRFYTDLFMVGMLYHLYNQFAFNTLERVSPVSHGVCNVVKRVAIIGSSVVFFNQVLTTQAMVGTVIALAGTWLYTEMSSKNKHKKAPPPAPAGGAAPAAA